MSGCAPAGRAAALRALWLAGTLAGSTMCRVCGSAPRLRRARSALVYDERARALVRSWKEHGRRDLVHVAAKLVTEAVPPPAASVLTFVPADDDRRLERGHAPPVRSPKPSPSAGPFRSPTSSAAPGDCRLSEACRSSSGGVTCAARSSREGRWRCVSAWSTTSTRRARLPTRARPRCAAPARGRSRSYRSHGQFVKLRVSP